MTTNQGLLIGGVVLGGGILLYALSSSQKKILGTASSTSVASAGGLLSGLGTFIKDIGGTSSSTAAKPPASYSSLSTPNSNVSSPISSDSSGFGITPTEQTNVDNYDDQAGTVYGIAGIDF